jgi:SAM-dependent methyltransferase
MMPGPAPRNRQTGDTLDLHNLEESIRFYEQRYAAGYMDEWDRVKKQRVEEIIAGLNLPATGEALDFGCGTGVFTEVIKKALPGWQVYGTDISAAAIDRAKERHKDCNFFVLNDYNDKPEKFDFLFTHHVLEHVYDINKITEEMVNFMKPFSSCLHILPCGNSGSFEHKLSLLVRQGIDYEGGGRFFFEDEGHVRRLDTAGMNQLLGRQGFILEKEYYSNQHYGAIDWITDNRDHIIGMSRWSDGINVSAKVKLLMLRIWLDSLYVLMFPAKYLKKLKERTHIGIKQYLFKSIAMIVYPLSAPIYNYVKNNSENEWRMRKTDRNGSEMYLYYRKTGS